MKWELEHAAIENLYFESYLSESPDDSKPLEMLFWQSQLPTQSLPMHTYRGPRLNISVKKW